ncbi:membrane-targeted effector domain-containing toxin [Pseudomonas sp. Z1-12]|uniref:membrane-targeted effector domain-containing toxin n=1 Tax=Pseudomonas sp. Z1-12 TaxID=2817408 RepID=UPI003DA82019
MSPKKPLRPKGTDTPTTDLSTIRVPAIPLPTRPPAPGASSTSHAQPSAAEPSSSADLSVPDNQPLSVVLANISSSTATAADTSPRSLARYVRNPPEGLPPAQENGLRLKGNEQYVDLDDRNVARVTYDPALKAYYAWDDNEPSASGPALYKPEGSTSWRENVFFTKLRLYQLDMDQRAIFDRRSEGLSSQSVKARDAALGPTYRTQQSRLKDDASLYFQNVQLTPRAHVPQGSGIKTFPHLLETILTHAPGVVMTERFSGTGSKMLLIDNMPALVKSGVTTLYLDRLRLDIDQVGLDSFAATGVMDGKLKRRLQHLDLNTDAVPPTPYTYENVLVAARENGLRVQALDCTARYQAQLSGDDPSRRLLAYHATQVINADRLAHPQGQWIALVGAPWYRKRNMELDWLLHRGTTFIYPDTHSLAQLQGVMSVHVEDLAHGPDMQVIQEASRAAADLNLNVGGQGLRPFELPARYRRVLTSEIRRTELSPDPDSVFARIPHRPGPDADAALTERYQRARDTISASHYFFEGQSVGRPRPAVPTLPRHSSLTTVLESVYRACDGLVMGGAYNAIGARRLLMENMPVLKEQQVKTLYLENLITEYDQSGLDAFASNAEMSDTLRANLRRQDELQHQDPQSAHSLVSLVNAARQNGIRVQALDTSISFRDELRRHAPERAKNFKYIAHTVIEVDQRQRGPHKWVALVESAYANTVANVPGLAELQGAVGVRVVDAGSQPTRVIPDEGEIISSLLPIAQPAGTRNPSSEAYRYVKSDLLIEMNTGIHPVLRAPVSPGKLLNRPDEFLIETEGEGFQLYLAKHRLGEFGVYPLLRSNGRISINITDVSQYPHRLQQVTGVQFQNIEALIWALKAAGLKQISGTTTLALSPLRLRDTYPQLNQPGMYFLSERPEGTAIFHRSRDSSVIRTLISKDEAGKLYIVYPKWDLTQAHLFDNLAALKAHLRRKGLFEVQHT